MTRKQLFVSLGGLFVAKAAAQSVYGGGAPQFGAPRFADAETPKGTIDGSNNVFVLTYTPFPVGAIQLFRNGQLQYAGSTADYTLIANVVSFSAAAVPQPGDSLIAWYRY